MLTKRDYVVLVNENAQTIGIEEKMKAHQEGLLHKAFSIFIVNGSDQMLIQQRALQKYHFAGLWSNACCSHPMPEEAMEQAIHRRLKEELGFDTAMKEAFSFIYKVRDEKSNLYEHELDFVLVGLYEGDVVADEKEINAFRWINISDLLSELELFADTYTPWFKMGVELLQRKGLLSSSAIKVHLKGNADLSIE